MAEKRMFSKKIIDTDWFMDMPISSQNLYFHLSMRADDDGFVASPKRIMKQIGASEDDYKVLISKKFIIPFDSGVCVITDWRINNYLRSDRYVETIYKEEKQLLRIDENGKYEFGIPMVYPVLSSSNTNINNNILINNIEKAEKEEKKEEERGERLKKLTINEVLSTIKDEDVKSLLKKFIEHRKQKKPITAYGLQLIINKLRELSYGDSSKAIDIINQSIERGWLSVFPLDIDKGATNKGEYLSEDEVQKLFSNIEYVEV